MRDGSFNREVVQTLRPRTKWVWRLLFIKVWLSAFLLIAAMLGAGALMLVAAFEDEVPWDERLLTFAGGVLVLFVCLGVIRMALPEQWQGVARKNGSRH
ncbi:hypothetical protein [Pseudomonas akapageensis]|uniref:hypothetical protein n=1 Tax=Pseudomonas akapageensis TaxID=2609961 RepID=UPI00140AEBA4|nr:hypothetical protein [Pseudomonas akapageensis]